MCLFILFLLTVGLRHCISRHHGWISALCNVTSCGQHSSSPVTCFAMWKEPVSRTDKITCSTWLQTIHDFVSVVQQWSNCDIWFFSTADWRNPKDNLFGFSVKVCSCSFLVNICLCCRWVGLQLLINFIHHSSVVWSNQCSSLFPKAQGGVFPSLVLFVRTPKMTQVTTIVADSCSVDRLMDSSNHLVHLFVCNST